MASLKRDWLGLGLFVGLVVSSMGLGHACSEIGVDGSGPPLPRAPQVDAGNPAVDCERAGLRWVVSGAFAAGGYCELLEPMAPPPAINLHWPDAGPEVR